MPRRKRIVTDRTLRGGKGSRFHKPLEKGAKMRSEEDALGSYTGVPAEGGVPEQDADDL